MATTTSTLVTGHEDMIHDAQMDYYGKRLATASSDRTVKIFDVVGTETQSLVADLLGHEGPVWRVAWAHPKFDSLLASCSYDRRVIIWKEGTTPGQWEKFYEFARHESSVNAVAWAPHECGLMFACASADSCISVVSKRAEQDWSYQKIKAHTLGCNAISWGPAVQPGAIMFPGPQPAVTMSFASGGCDNYVKVWTWSKATQEWISTALAGHTDWVRDVAWAPGVGLPTSTIASCGQDKTVRIWRREGADAEWVGTKLTSELFRDVVWSVSWSITGNILAVTCGDGGVSLWKESLDGKWGRISEGDE